MTMQNISRRFAMAAGGAAVLTATLGATDAGLRAAPGPAPAPAPAQVPLRLTDAALLDAYVRLRARTDGGIAFGWLDALRYAVIDGEIHPLCRVLAAGVARFNRVSAENYDAVMLEVAHYVDIGSGELLDTLRMPGTGQVVQVPRYRTGPKRVRFGVAVDESEAAGEGIPRKQLEAFAPVGQVRLQRSVSDPCREGDALFLRHEEYGRVVPRDPGAARIFYREWTIWRGPADRALDTGAVSAPSEMSYSAITSWRPWMQMGAVRGHTVENGRGSKIGTLAELPENIRRLTARLHPDVMDNPERVLDGAA